MNYKNLLHLNNIRKQNLKNIYVNKNSYKYTIIKENDEFYIKKYGCDTYNKLRDIDDILTIYNTNEYNYISNISILKNCFDFNIYLLKEDEWKLIKFRLFVRRPLHFSIIKVDNIDIYMSKLNLLYKVKIEIKHNCYYLIFLDNKAILVSDYSLVINMQSNVSFKEFSFLKSINIENLTIDCNRLGCITTLSRFFSGCTNLELIVFKNFNTSLVKDFSYMFYDCKSLKSLDICCFNTENAFRMTAMFQCCSNLKLLDLQHFDVSNVGHFDEMFRDCLNLQTLRIDTWIIGNCNYSFIDMRNMFRFCCRLNSINIDYFKKLFMTSKVKLFKDYMFYKTPYENQINLYR